MSAVVQRSIAGHEGLLLLAAFLAVCLLQALFAIVHPLMLPPAPDLDGPDAAVLTTPARDWVVAVMLSTVAGPIGVAAIRFLAREQRWKTFVAMVPPVMAQAILGGLIIVTDVAQQLGFTRLL